MRVFTVQCTHLSLLFQQHLLEDWHNPLLKYDVVAVRHQKVSDPVLKTCIKFTYLKICLLSISFSKSQSLSVCCIICTNSPTCSGLFYTKPCQTARNPPSKKGPDTWSSPPRCLQPWSLTHQPWQGGGGNTWGCITFVRRAGMAETAPFCAEWGSGCSLWLRCWWG